jgi:hypothetical protein
VGNRVASCLSTQADYEARAGTSAYYAEKLGMGLKPKKINYYIYISRNNWLLSTAPYKGVRDCAALSKFHAFAFEAKAGFEALKKWTRRLVTLR